MACRPLFRRSRFLFILIALWPLTFFTHGYDGYHEASLANSCSLGNDIAENNASNFASYPWNHNRLIIRIVRGKGYFSSRINYHSCSVSGFHLIRLFISGDVCLNPGPEKYENCDQATTRNHGCFSAPCRISSIYNMAGHNKPRPRSGGANFNNLITIQPAGAIQVVRSDLFRFASLNTRSIRKKAMFLKDFVVENQIDLLAITETWLDLNNPHTANIINEFCSVLWSLRLCIFPE